MGFAVSWVLAQSTTSDSTKKTTDTSHTDKPRILMSYGLGDNEHQWSKDSTGNRSHQTYPKAYIGITFSRLDLGLATLVDNGSFTLSPQKPVFTLSVMENE